MKEILKSRGVKIAVLFLLDLLFINLSALLSLKLGFNFELTEEYLKYRDILINSTPVYSFMLISVFYLFGLYKSLWKYASIKEMVSIVAASVVGMTLIYVSFSLANITFKVNFYIINTLLIILSQLAIRFSYRILRVINVYSLNTRRKYISSDDVRVLVIGAGYSAVTIAKEIRNYPRLNKNIIGFLDDDNSKIKQRINGIKVIGNIDMLESVVNDMRIDEIIFAIPSLSNSKRKDILERCKRLDVRLKTLPALYELIDGKIEIGHIRNVEIEDLLGRKPVKIDNPEIIDYIRGKTVLITGGGGSIGSELCRQIATLKPNCLIIFDIYENNAYAIQNELKRKYGQKLNLKVLIGSVRDRARLEDVFSTYRPHVVFHAAAHKHVPLMQENPLEAIKNNSIGTYNTADISGKYGSEKFVLISTDKAVNPYNVMGASKRLAEIFVQDLEYVYSDTEYMAVRFGNVLGSSGSVIPLFKDQIFRGGPVTVTHPDVIRYFMTIPEAVQLVLQAGSMVRGGETFVLDMGEPVKIVDLARDLIKLSGFEPNEDIAIEFTGLRPGEKLYEELLLSEEGIKNTLHEKIFVIEPDEKKCCRTEAILESINNAIERNDIGLLEDELKRVIPSYKRIEEGTS